MSAPLVPDDAIPELAEQLDLPMLRALRRASQGDFVMNDRNIDQEATGAFQRLSNLGLVDPGHDGSASGPILHWTLTSNGTRVLRHIKAAVEDEDAPPDQSGAWLCSS